MGSLVCYSCGASLSELTLPLRRLEVCPSCEAELHVCRMCRFYDTSVAKACREPIAEEVRDKERANFCDYYSPRADAYVAPDGAAERARAELESLFGDGKQRDESSPEDRLSDLFKKGDD